MFIAEWFFEYWGNQLDRYLSLIDAGMESVIFEIFREIIKLNIEKFGIGKKENTDPIFLESYASHVAKKNAFCDKSLGENGDEKIT